MSGPCLSRRAVLLAGAGAALGALSGCRAEPASSAEDDPTELILRYAENQPDDYPTSKAARAFAERVAQRTGGRV